MAEIVFTAGPYAGHKLDVPETGIVLGRSAESADLVLNDGPSVMLQRPSAPGTFEPYRPLR